MKKHRINIDNDGSPITNDVNPEDFNKEENNIAPGYGGFTKFLRAAKKKFTDSEKKLILEHKEQKKEETLYKIQHSDKIKDNFSLLNKGGNFNFNKRRFIRNSKHLEKVEEEEGELNIETVRYKLS
jgi:hypothetical protein